jgi:hypothetical protein
MKKAILSFLLLFPLLTTVAQLKPIAESLPFEEPEDGYARMLFLKNGNTAYLRITKKDGIDVRLYDSQHKQIAAKTLEPSYGKLRAMSVEGIYDVGGNIALFISEWEDNIPTLYRVQIDAQTAELKETKTIATLQKATMGQGYAVAFGGVPLPDFLVRKDPGSDNYGAVRYNTFESDRTKRVELIQYNAAGSETGRNFLSSPDAKYKFTQIIDFVIVGETAYALLYSYNTPSSGGAANELLLATAKDGVVSYANLGKSITRRIDDGILRYNHVTKNLIFLTTEHTSSERTGVNATTARYATQFSIIDPANPSIKTPVDLRRSGINMKYRKIFKDAEDSYAAMPQQLYINDDGSFTLLLEEVTQIIRTSMRNGMATSSHNSGTELGTAAVITYNEDGTERSSALIPKHQTTYAGMFDGVSDYVSVGGFYIAARNNGAVALSAGNQYKSLVYLNGKKKSYVLLNDVEENEERIQKGKLTNVRGVGDCEAYIYDLSATGSAILPRTAAFTRGDKKDRNLAIFNISDYDSEKGIYTTLKLEKGKGVKVVWLGE